MGEGGKEFGSSSFVSYFLWDIYGTFVAFFSHILQTRMEEPCFDVLRTQLQLGYTVYCQNLITNGILGLAVTVQFQAQKFT